jgi:protein O-mannosyl-transferase
MASGLKTKQRPLKGAATVHSKTLEVRTGQGKEYAWFRRNLVLCLLLAAATIGVYFPVGHHPFIEYDDQSYVTENPHVQSGLTWETFTWALTSTDASNWHPLTWLSHAADVSLFGLNPAGHHWTSLLIHVVNVILLFLLLQRATGAMWQSFLVAALFALHPMNVESVAWIAERKNVLSTTLFFLTLAAYGWYAQRPSVRRYAAVAGLFTLGLAAKPMVITLPFVLLLLDFWPLQRIENWTAPSENFPAQQAPSARLAIEKLPLLVLSAASAMITVATQNVAEISTQALPLSVRLPASLYAYGVYIWKTFWPVNLALIYPHPGRTLGLWRPLFAALMIVVVTIAAWKQRSARPYLIVGWFWFLGTAVPIIGIMQVGVQVVADRYAYLPLLGLFVMIVWDFSSLADAVKLERGPLAAVAAIALAILSFLTWRQVGYWRSSTDLWAHALQVTENNSMAEEFLSNSLYREGRYEESMAHLRTYAALEPLDPGAHVRVGADFQDHGQIPEAIREYEQAIRGSATLTRFGAESALDSRMLAMTYLNLGLAYAQMGDSAKDAENTRKALNADADAVRQMVQDLARGLTSSPTSAGFVRLGMILTQLGQASEAQQAFARARQIEPALQLPPGVDAATTQH